MTRVTTSPMRVYRERVSPVRVITPSARIYRRDAYSPVRVITSPSRVMSVRVRPSVLSREFDRIENKHRRSPIGFDALDDYLNSPYTSVSAFLAVDCVKCHLTLVGRHLMMRQEIFVPRQNAC
jgi:hypothetical protein